MMEATCAALGAGIAYLLSAFVAADMDFRAWDEGWRFVSAVAMTGYAAIAIISVRMWRAGK